MSTRQRNVTSDFKPLWTRTRELIESTHTLVHLNLAVLSFHSGWIDGRVMRCRVWTRRNQARNSTLRAPLRIGMFGRRRLVQWSWRVRLGGRVWLAGLQTRAKAAKSEPARNGKSRLSRTSGVDSGEVRKWPPLFLNAACLDGIAAGYSRTAALFEAVDPCAAKIRPVGSGTQREISVHAAHLSVSIP